MKKLSMIKMITSLTILFSCVAWAGPSNWTPTERVLKDPQIQGLHSGSKRKYKSCDRLTSEMVRWKVCLPGEFCEFRLSFWCRVGVDASQIAIIDGRDLITRIDLYSIEFQTAVEN